MPNMLNLSASNPLPELLGGTGNSTGTAPPSGAAGGALTGTYPNPDIAANVITYGNLVQIAASSLVGNPTGSLATGQGITLGSTLIFSGTALQTAAMSGDVISSANSFFNTLATVNSDIGTFGSATQVGIFTANGKGQITAASNVTISGVSPGGSASGDLSGTYPSPTVAKINGVSLGSTTATAANLLIGNGSQWVTNAITGNVTLSSAGVTTIGALQVTNAMLAGSISLTTKVTGILPTANGGSGVNNSSTMTVGGNLNTASSFTTSGANALTLTTTATTNATLPSGTTTLVPTTGTGATGTWSITASIANTGITFNNATNASFFPLFAASTTNGNQSFNLHASLIFNPATSTLTTTTFSGALNGNATTATNGVVTTGSYADPAWITSLAGSKISGTVTTATNATNGATVSTSTNASFYPIFAASSSNSNQPFNLNSSFSINPSTGLVSIPLQLGIGATQTQAVTTALSIRGANNSTDSAAHFFTAADQYPLLQILPFSHDNVSLSFDSYYSSGWKSSSASGSFQISKSTNLIYFNYGTAAAGAALTWNTGFTLNTSGVINIPNLTASSLVTTNASKDLVSSNTLSSTVLGNITKVTVTTLSSGSGTYNSPAGCTHTWVRGWGAGGGGGGVAGVASNAGGGGGGGGGAYVDKIFTGSLSVAYSVGAGGPGGATGANGGTAGGDTTFSTLTAGGGGPGAGTTAGLVAATVGSGVGGSATGGDINAKGFNGNPGITFSGTLAMGGGGGASPGGAGSSAFRVTANNGTAGSSPGGGGGGGYSTNATSRSGGNGEDGELLIHEYYNG